MLVNTGGAAPPCVVVGASLAGLRACEGLRKGGYDGPIVVFGEEADLPYNRPPLSKTALTCSGDLEPEPFRIPPVLDDVEWRLGERVTGADLATRTVTAAGRDVQAWSGLIIATGLAPRRLDLPGPALGRHVIRTVGDARALRDALRPGGTAVVIGAGFIGCELAVSLVSAGIRTHVVDPLTLPMERQLGSLPGARVRETLLSSGVVLHLGAVPVAYEGDGSVEGVRLDDGVLIPATAVIEAVGSIPNTDWLAGNGLDITDGVACDGRLRVGGRPDVFACGDVARYPHPLQGGVPRRMEHWTMAGDTGRHAGRSLARHLTGQELPPGDFSPVPSFWSDLGSTRIQSFGLPGQGMEDIRVLEGDTGGDVAVGYHRDGSLVGVVLFGLGHRHQFYRGQVEQTLASELAPSGPRGRLPETAAG